MPSVAGAGAIVGAGWATYRTIGRWAKFNETNAQRFEDDEYVREFEREVVSAERAAVAAAVRRKLVGTVRERERQQQRAPRAE